jgi:hypothetical protein
MQRAALSLCGGRGTVPFATLPVLLGVVPYHLEIVPCLQGEGIRPAALRALKLSKAAEEKVARLGRGH